MKHSTQYLFDAPRSAYEPELTLLATRKIADGEKLLKKIARLKSYKCYDVDKLIDRYKATRKAVEHWVNQLEEE